METKNTLLPLPGRPSAPAEAVAPAAQDGADPAYTAQATKAAV